MRLALLMNVASPWSRATATMMARLGHEVHVIDFAEARGMYHATNESEIARFRQSIHSVHLLEGFKASATRYLLALPRFRKILRAVQPKALLTLYGGGFAQMAFLSGFRPYAVFAVGSDVLLTRGLARPCARVAFQAAARVFANGQFLAEKTRALAPRANVTPLLLGVDTKRFTPGAPSAPVQFLSNRGFRFPYNNEYIIQGIARMAPTKPFIFHFASGGPELAKMQALAHRILPPNVFASIKFWGGVTNEQMLDLTQASRFFVSMSTSDGTATSLLEAMSCDLFPILSDIPQNREWVDLQAPTGALVPLDHPEALGKALRQVIEKPEVAERAAAANRARILERADAETNTRQLADMLAALS